MERTRTCGNCEADVHIDATYCPFCGADLMATSMREETPPPRDPVFANHSVQESLASLYKPPYVSRDSRGLGVPDERRDTGYAEPERESHVYNREELAPPQEEAPTQEGGGLWSILLLTVGANLLALGLILFFFSEGGTLTLKWNAHAWFLYCLVSVPLLMLGWRLLSPSTKEEL